MLTAAISLDKASGQILLMVIAFVVIFLSAHKIPRRFRTMTVAVLTICVLSLPLVFFGIHLYQIDQQFEADMQYEGASGYIMPNGVWYNYDTLSQASERSIVKSFYLGDEIDTDLLPLFTYYEPRNANHSNSKFYYVKERSSLGTIIREDPMIATKNELIDNAVLGKQSANSTWRILRAAGFTTYCVNHHLSHEEIFPTIMEEIYHCYGADSIASIYVDARSDASDADLVQPLTITDRGIIDEIWTILLRSTYWHDTDRICANSMFTDARKISETGWTQNLSAEKIRRIILSFEDGVDFQFSFYNAETMVMTLEHTADDPYMKTEALYLTKDDNERLMELFGVSVSNEVP